MQDFFFFFACGGAKCEGTQTVSRQELGPYQFVCLFVCLFVCFQASCSWWSEGLFAQSFSLAPPIQALRVLPCLESFSVVWHIRNIEGYPWLGSYSVDQACQALKGALWVVFYSVVRCLMSQPLYCSAANAGMWGERGYGDGSNPYTWLSSIALYPWLPGFPPLAFPITVFSLTSPQSISLQSTAALTLGSLHTPQTPAPSHCTFQGTLVPVWDMYGCARTLWFSLHLGCHGSAVSLLALNVSRWLRPLPQCGDWPLLQFSWRQVQSYWHSCFSPLVPSSYGVLHGSIYSFPLVKYSCLLSAGVLHTLLYLKVYSWCISGERCIPRPPTPPPACSLDLVLIDHDPLVIPMSNQKN